MTDPLAPEPEALGPESPDVPRAIVPAKTLLVAGGAILAVAGLAIGVGFYLTRNAEPSTPPPAIKGTMQVNGNCHNIGFSDISVGTQVKLTGPDEDKVLAVTELRAGSSDCTFAFEFTNPPTDQTLYGVSMGNANRGTFHLAKDRAFGEGFRLELGRR